jgi:hypothetical protein
LVLPIYYAEIRDEERFFGIRLADTEKARRVHDAITKMDIWMAVKQRWQRWEYEVDSLWLQVEICVPCGLLTTGTREGVTVGSSCP